MLIYLLAFIGGVLTILSPCILPVLPFVFARADQPFVRSGLPLLIGMAATFALVATLATLGGQRQSIWPHRRNGPAQSVRPDAAGAGHRRPADKAAGGLGQQSVEQRAG